MLLSTAMVGISAKRTPLSVALTTTLSDTGNKSTYTFSGASIGGPGLIVVAIQAGSGGATPGTALVSVTIGGGAATLVAAAEGTQAIAGIAFREITSGSTADIVVNCDSTISRIQITVYRIQGYGQTSAHHSQTYASASSGSAGVTVNTTDGGVLIGSFFGEGPSSVSWTNAGEDTDNGLEAGSRVCSAAHSSNLTGAATAVTATPDVSGKLALAVASFT